ncbi:MAG: addiction module protein [Pseudomonadota bacterium]
MPLSLTEIEKEVGRLTLDERDELIRFLLVGLEPTDEGDVEAAWEEEVLARSEDVHEGRVTPVPAEEALARLHRSLP